MKSFFLLCAITMCSVFFAQNKITGTVRGVEAATILILNAKDSAVLRTVIADKDGNFQIENIADGSYLLKASASGYKNAFTKVLQVDASHTSVKRNGYLVKKTEAGQRGNICTGKEY